MNDQWLLAQATDTSETPETTSVVAEHIGSEQTTTSVSNQDIPAQQPARKQSAPGGQIFFIVALLVLMYVLLFRGPRRQQKKQQNLVKSLQKNDKILTRGGIIGTVIDVRDNEILVKVDESTNTKVRFSPSAVVQKLTGEKD